MDRNDWFLTVVMIVFLAFMFGLCAYAFAHPEFAMSPDEARAYLSRK